MRDGVQGSVILDLVGDYIKAVGKTKCNFHFVSQGHNISDTAIVLKSV